MSDTTDSDIPGDEPTPGDGGGMGAGKVPPSAGGLPPEKDVSPITIEDEMRRSYLDYAMSVIMSRALPDARDGLKPVHRRILFSMSENGYDWNKPYRKSARVVGDVIGKYHPHGDQSIYDALVRMTQSFSMCLPLIDGQGNFGSVDGDAAAAMRYTEVRMAKSAHALVNDIDKDTVDFQDNYDGSEKEPKVLPAEFPNLLVNGAAGIAVGMATNVPPHNLGEVIDACIALIDNPAITLEELIEHVPAPDFPTGGIMLGRAGARAAYHTGRGSIVVRGRVEIEEGKRDRLSIIISEIPYQVNKTTMIERIAELVRDKRIEGISDLRDESDRDGMRVVIELKRDAMPDVVLNQLYRFSPLQSSFSANMMALDRGKPELMNLKQLIEAFTHFREEVVTRRVKFELAKARDRAHVLVGLAIAVANIDEVIQLIRTAPDPATAKERLMTRDWPARDIEPLIVLIADPRHKLSEEGTYKLSETQAKAILDLRLQRLTALGRDEIGDELTALGEKIADYLDILRSRERVLTIIRNELGVIKAEFATPRRTEHHRGRGRVRGRGPDPARGHGRHGQPSGLHQARAALDLSRAAPRRTRTRRHGDEGRGFRHAAFRRQHAHAGAFLLVHRHGLQAEGLASARLDAAGARQGDDQHPAAGAGRDDHHHHAAARRRGELGQASCDVRDAQGQCAAERAVGLRADQPQRQDRDEVRGRGRER